MKATNDTTTVPAPLPDALAAGVVAAATWRELARRKRLLSVGFFLMLPVVLLLAVRLWYPDGAPPDVLLSLLARYAFIPFLVPITAMA